MNSDIAPYRRPNHPKGFDDTKKKLSRKNIYCHNCGKAGHPSKKCKFPVMSYGIILFYDDKPGKLLQNENFRTRVRQHYTKNCLDKPSIDTITPIDFEIDLNDQSILESSERIIHPPPGFEHLPPKTVYELNDDSEQSSSKNFPTNLDELLPFPEDLEKRIKELSVEGASQLKYLMILDRYTPDYVQIIWGNYDFENPDYIKTLVSRLTKTEIRLINTYSLDHLFAKYWIFSKKDALNFYKKQYQNSKKMFSAFKNGVTNSKGDCIKFETMVAEANPGWDDPFWGFPKGRRRRYNYESDLECAMREFKEETGIDQSQYQILQKIKPIEEIFKGSNGTTYKHIYFLAIAKNYIPIYLNPFNTLQLSEIKKIGWYSYEQGIKLIRDYHIEKKTLFSKINNYLQGEIH